MDGLYEYITPRGWGDTFFQYVFDAQDAGLTNGTTYMRLGVQVNDGKFVLRKWGGLGTIGDGLQIYDWLARQFAASPMLIGQAALGSGRGQMAVFPEVEYPDGGNLRFDLVPANVLPVATIGGVDVVSSQLVFTGVRRREGVVGDPIPSQYRYKETDFAYPYTLTINDPAATAGVLAQVQRIQIQVTDYDFELRQVLLGLPDDTFSGISPFKITLYDTNRVQMSNLPVLANEFFYLNPITSLDRATLPAQSAGQLNFTPCPPMLYRVNSVIQFDINSLLTAVQVPGTFQLLFKGIRRIPC